MAKKLTDKPVVSAINDNDNIFINQGNAVKQVPFSALKTGVGGSTEVNLLQNAFYTEPNNADPRGSKYCIVGGNDNVRQSWCDKQIPILLDPKTGFYCRLSKDDMRYTADGVQVFNGTTVTTGFEKAEWMGVVPAYSQYLQDVTVGGTVHHRVWVGENNLPGGRLMPQMVIGMFKSYKDGSSKLHSRPGVVPSANFTVYNAWQFAQNTDQKCGLAGIQFRTYLLQLLNAKFGYRSCQEVKDGANALVYGPGLDGTESCGTGESAGDVGFSRQSSIKTGATLALGKTHGKAAVTDTTNKTCHSVLMGVFENPWGQYWEFVGDLCSLKEDSQNRVIHMLENTMPKNGSSFITEPTLADFAKIEHEILTRASAGDKTFFDAANQIYAGVPVGSLSGVDDGDAMYYAAAGQVWRWGGSASSGAIAGLGYSNSTNAWTLSDSSLSARLAFFGTLQETTADHLKTLLAAS